MILTCTGVSFAHGSNDGQKGMGRIMLILIGAAPTAYALKRAMDTGSTPAFMAATQNAEKMFTARSQGTAAPDAATARSEVTAAVRDRAFDKPQVFAALSGLAREMGSEV